jgi:anti-sigma-K factor RskA
MTTRGPDQEHDMLAAEHALGVLHGTELARARELALSSRDFAQSVEDWQKTLATIANEATEQEPDRSLWSRIERALGASSDNEFGKVVQLKRQLRRWRTISFAATAAAAVLLLLVVNPNQEATNPGRVESAPVLVAALSSEQTGTSLSVAYDPTTQSLLVTPGVLKGATGHQHELWIIPAGGKPVAVGLIAASEPQRLQLQNAILPHFRSQSTLAVSVEPVGGSRTGQPTGPVVASGELSSI